MFFSSDEIYLNGFDYPKALSFEELKYSCPFTANKFETLDVDSVIVALGTGPNPIIQRSAQTEGLNIDVNSKGYIVVNETTGETSIPKIYAGGDVAPIGESTAINAMGAGKRAAKAINELLK